MSQVSVVSVVSVMSVVLVALALGVSTYRSGRIIRIINKR